MANPKNLRFAFVKQEIHSDLYNCQHDADPATKILSSLSRVGPSGLFTLYDADFYVVKVDKAPECQTWQEVRKRIQNRRRLAERHKKYSISVDDVKWSDYDIVICLDISIPERIVKKYRRTLWCYMPTEPSCMASYKGPLRASYNARLNQDVGRTIQTKFGVVCFPYSFIEPGSLKKLSTNHSGPQKKDGVFVEYNWVQTSNKAMKIKGLGPVRTIVPAAGKRSQDPNTPYISAVDHRIRTIDRLCASKFFLKYGGRIIRGNSIAEAMACNAVAVCKPSLIIYSQLLCKRARIKGLAEAIEFIKSVDETTRQQMIKRQNELMWSLLINRPIQSLMNLFELKRK